MTRNERRNAAKARLAAKSARIEAAAIAARADANRAIVRDNLRKPVERNYYPQSIIGTLGRGAPRFKDSSNVARFRLTGLDDRGRYHSGG